MKLRLFLVLLVSLMTVVVFLACAPAAQPTPTVPPKSPVVATPATKAPAASPVPGASPAAAGVGDPARGKAVFDANCNGCHPGGRAGTGPDIRGTNPDKVKQQVRNGGQRMPAFPPSQISEQQLNDLSAYVNSLPKQ